MPSIPAKTNGAHDYILGYAALTLILLSITLALQAIDAMLLGQTIGSRKGRTHIRRQRRSFASLRNEYGELFNRAYRIDHAAFQKLYKILEKGISNFLEQESRGESFYVPNGPIDYQVRLAMALRYFAGGSYLDILMSHGVGKTDFYKSVWAVVHAVNNADELMLQFPKTIDECTATANEFAARSKAGFNNCVGCVDGVLLWIEKPGKKNVQL